MKNVFVQILPFSDQSCKLGIKIKLVLKTSRCKKENPTKNDFNKNGNKANTITESAKKTTPSNLFGIDLKTV